MKTKAFLFVLPIALLVGDKTTAQTSIGGVINIYTPVTSIANCACPDLACNSITVSSVTGFSAGDKILVFQMKGAQVDTSNSSTHGSVLNLYDAGNYEYATIASISGNVITTDDPLKETYFTNSNPADSAYVQVIRVAVYTGDVDVTSTLMPQVWNPETRTGGVLALEVSGTLTLYADISADGCGFSGARREVVAVSCEKDTAFYYQSTSWNHSSCTSCGYAYDGDPRLVGLASYGGCGTTCFTTRMYINDKRTAGYRGEGVAANTFFKRFANSNIAYFDKGRGKWSNGGGGGHNHNGGGGGGANYGSGGWGGNMYNVSSTKCPTSQFSVRRGYGGESLSPNGSKIFMGGGGGEGHDNGGQGSTGTRGGGIIFIQAANIGNPDTYSISANGTDNTVAATSDGSGGGGAGGSILLDVSGSYTSPITISAVGGKGGDNSQSNCHGPGGGGGGGVICFSNSSQPANTTAVVTGGASGTNTHPSFDCGEASWGSTNGSDGGVMTGLYGGSSVFFNSNSCAAPLPVQLISFMAQVSEPAIRLTWTTATEVNNDYFAIERSVNGKTFYELSVVKGAGTSSSKHEYEYIDEHPLMGEGYYRLKQVDFDGHVSFSQTLIMRYRAWEPKITVMPNPADAFLTLNVEEEEYSVVLIDYQGVVRRDMIHQNEPVRIQTGDLPEGVYMVLFSARDKKFHRKLIIAH